MTRVVVLGGSGMLGSALVACLAQDPALEVHASAREHALSRADRARLGPAAWFELEADGGTFEDLPRAAWVVNAIGVIKHRMRDAQAVERAIAVNAAFPHRLARWARETGAKVVQIATDCVYSGALGSYAEPAPHDALDVYGKTKSLGEVASPGFYNLRCSMVGPEANAPGVPGTSLLEWFLGQPRAARVDGFTNHRWNGITTLAFARLVRGLVREHETLALPSLQHVVPADAVTKADLLGLFARSFGRDDVTVAPRPAPEAIDRTLTTAAPERNAALWRAAGYDAPPTIRALVEELAGWTHPLRGLEARR